MGKSMEHAKLYELLLNSLCKKKIMAIINNQFNVVLFFIIAIDLLKRSSLLFRTQRKSFFYVIYLTSPDWTAAQNRNILIADPHICPNA